MRDFGWRDAYRVSSARIERFAMTLIKSLPVLAVMTLVMPTSMYAQAPACLDPHHSVESLKESLLQSAAGPRGHMGVSAIIVGGVFGRCPLLHPDETDLDVVLDDLVRWVADRGEPELSNGVMRGVTVGFMAHGERLGVDIPLSALVYAVREGRDARTRGYSLRSLNRLADAPQVRAQLLQWARERQGPPLFPDLPEQIARSLYHIVGIKSADLLRAELEADPSLIRNARVRCWAEGKDRPGAGRLPGAANPCPD